jgi:L-fucose mutarotase
VLNGIDPKLTPILLYVLARMGHGDELVVADSNFPAHSTASACVVAEPIYLTNLGAPEAISLITALMPLDAFHEYGALRMEIDNLPNEMGEVHQHVWNHLETIKSPETKLSSINREIFYTKAKKCFALVQTMETRPFGCFILRKGVIF